MKYPTSPQGYSQAIAQGNFSEAERIKKELTNAQTYKYGNNQSGVVLPNANLNSMSRLASNSSGTTTTSNYADTSSGNTSSGQDDFEAIFGMSLNEYLNSVNGSADKLLEIAQGDYNLVAKWIENDYTQATGTDDQARKDFMLKVSNDLEARIGTIAFDYETGTYRTKEDMGIQTGRATEDKDSALKRLMEDDATLTKLYNENAGMDRTLQGESLNQRGLLTGKREETVGVGSNDVGRLEGQIEDKFDALKRATTRTTDDINTGYDRNIADINLTGNRQLEDLTTGARRGMIGATNTRQRGLDQAEQARKARELQIEQERARQRALANAYSLDATANYAGA